MATATLLCGSAASARAATSCSEGMDVLLLLDRSGSMKSFWTDATASVNSIVSAFSVQHAFGLLLFPDGGGCSVTTVEVPVGYGKQAPIAAALAGATPSGWTPLADALVMARDHLRTLGADRPRAVVVITDGVETCASPSEPSAVAGELLAEGIKVFVVALKVTAPQLDAIAKAGGTGGASVVEDPNDLYESLDVILDLCCGNGELDPGEACDKGITPGEPDACPASCDDGDPCTADRVSCKNTCTSKPVRGTKEDGCCRGGDDADLDPDCTALCGNGVLDGGERCDTAIAAGELGACDCDDDDPCTDDAVRGCYLSCYHTDRGPDPQLADGCCPGPSITAGEDVDCAAPDAGPSAAGAGAADAGATGPSDDGGCALTGSVSPISALLVALGLVLLGRVRRSGRPRR